MISTLTLGHRMLLKCLPILFLSCNQPLKKTKEISKEEVFFSQGYYDSAAIIYNQKILKGIKLNDISLNSAFICYVLSDKKSEAIDLLKKFNFDGTLVNKFYFSYILDDTSFIQRKDFTEFISKYYLFCDSIYSTFKTIEKPLLLLLDTINYNDQIFRIFSNNQHLTQLQQSEYATQSIMADTWNQSRIETVFAKYGWPELSQIGGNRSESIFLVILHANTSYQNKYLAAVEGAFKKGKIRKHEYPYFIDRLLVDNGKMQKYGTQVRQCEGKSSFFLCPIENPKDVDQLRIEVELPLIREYLRSWNLEWDLANYNHLITCN